ncbi:MAG: 4-hydroxythreonine-4-phosphate dehydrogenase PdxA [Desulfarculus sp.]|nr:4-hydroxythreonine-4-phosphate dehydrogenase PdxA [Desulfarculus sp.]
MTGGVPNGRSRLAVTLGDPAGVGPEIVARVCHDPEVREKADILVVGRRLILAAGAMACGLSMPTVEMVEVGPGQNFKPGSPTPVTGRQAGAFVEEAVRLCTSGQVAGMVTAPISKEALRAGGYPDTGHTSLLGRLLGVPKPVMMLAGSRLKVVLATVHCAYREVIGRLSPQGIAQTGLVAARDLQRFLGVKSPRVAVAALNPHAGESGLFGDEEQTIIAPAIEILRQAGVQASGPHPPDTVFWRAARGEFDLVVCMYHDQGLIPLKLLHFEDAVNVTLGLPIIRTSVDHGTAYDIAGQGRANPASLKAAVLLAAQMAARRANGA